MASGEGERDKGRGRVCGSFHQNLLGAALDASWIETGRDSWSPEDVRVDNAESAPPKLCSLEMSESVLRNT